MLAKLVLLSCLLSSHSVIFGRKCLQARSQQAASKAREQTPRFPPQRRLPNHRVFKQHGFRWLRTPKGRTCRCTQNHKVGIWHGPYLPTSNRPTIQKKAAQLSNRTPSALLYATRRNECSSKQGDMVQNLIDRRT